MEKYIPLEFTKKRLSQNYISTRKSFDKCARYESHNNKKETVCNLQAEYLFQSKPYLKKR